MGLILTPRGDTAPPAWILSALAAVDPALSLKATNGRLAVMLAWRENDPRRVLIQKGELSAEAASDVICFLPADCTADEAVGYFEKAAKRCTESGDARARMLIAQVQAHNDRQYVVNGQQTLDYIEEVGPVYMKPEGRFFQTEPQGPARKRSVLPSNVTT